MNLLEGNILICFVDVAVHLSLHAGDGGFVLVGVPEYIGLALSKVGCHLNVALQLLDLLF